jgi:uncharacterized phage-like protein YoqJ
MRVIVSGHRPPRLCGGYEINGVHWQHTETSKLVKEFFRTSLISLRNNLGNARRELICGSGMAQGADQLFCQVCNELEIPYIAFVPYVNFGLQWPEAAQQMYSDLILQSSEVRYTSEEYYRGVERDRDRDIVNWASGDMLNMLLAVWDMQKIGGTYATFNRAKKKKMNIVVYNPKTREITRQIS